MTCKKKAGFAGLYKYILFAAVIIAAFAAVRTVSVRADEEETEWVHYIGVANGTVNVRSGPGVEYDQLVDASDEKIKLSAQEEVVIIDEAPSSEGKIWYKIEFERGGNTYTGYATSSYVSKDEERTITPTPTPEPTPVPTTAPTTEPTLTEAPADEKTDEVKEEGSSRQEILKVVLFVIVIAILLLIGLIAYKLFANRENTSGNAATRKVDRLKKLNIDNRDTGRKVPQIKRLDSDTAIPEEVRQDVYYKKNQDSEENDLKRNAEKETDERKALRAAIDRLQEHDIVYHTTYGEGEVFDNSDVKLIEVRFGNDMRFLKKDQLVAKRELLIVDEEEQSIVKRRNRKKTTK